MTASSSKSVSLTASSSSDQVLSKDQKAFNTLVRQIGERRQSIQKWEALSADFHPVYAGELVPLRATFLERSHELILKLDAQFDQEKLTLSERKAISSLIFSLMRHHGDGLPDDVQLKEVYNRHSGSDFDEDRAHEAAAFKSRLEQVLGESLGDDAVDSPEELLSRARARMAEFDARENAKKEARAQRKAKRSGPEKADASASKRELAQTELKQSLRDIYRKLASALHPDREPDEQLRAHKTNMMQSLNQAYEKQDLLQLLELQIQLQQIDQHALNDLGDDRLKQYNKLLKEQLSELDQELLMTEDRFMGSYGMTSHQRPTPAGALRYLHGEIAQTQEDIARLEVELSMLTDIKLFKRWLKDVKKGQREAAAYDSMDGFGY
jgi:hypothetical protein